MARTVVVLDNVIKQGCLFQATLGRAMDGKAHNGRRVRLQALDKALCPETSTAGGEAVAGTVNVGFAVQIAGGGDFDVEFGEGCTDHSIVFKWGDYHDENKIELLDGPQ